MQHNVIKARGLVRWYLRRAGFGSTTLPLWTPTIYILEEHWYDHDLLEHELVHVDQIRRMGRLRFLVAYLWYQARYGYRNNPLEIEAREAESRCRHEPV